MNTSRAAEEGTMKVWAITFKEYGGAEETVVERYGDTFRHLLFEDTAKGYHAALRAFQSLVCDRIGQGHAVYSYPGEVGPDARAHIVVEDSRYLCDDEDCLDPYSGDTIALRPYGVLAG